MRSFIFLSVFSGLLLSVCRDAGFAVAQDLKKTHARPRVFGHNRALPEINGTAIGVSDTALIKRGGSSQFTYFQDGTGACGIFNQPSDYIVALNSAQFDGGAHCFATITITVGGKSTQAQITDECPGCPYLGLDFSQGLFQYFADTSVGELYGDWTYGDGAPTTSATPTTSWAPQTTWSPPPPTSTYVYTPTSTSTSTWVSTTSTTSTTSSTISSSSTSSSAAVPTAVPTFTPQNPDMLVQLNFALIKIGSFVEGNGLLSLSSSSS